MSLRGEATRLAEDATVTFGLQVRIPGGTRVSRIPRPSSVLLNFTGCKIRSGFFPETLVSFSSRLVSSLGLDEARKNSIDITYKISSTPWDQSGIVAISFSVSRRRALDQRATEPRVAPPKPASNSGGQLKELHLKEIKAKPEAKPILQSLKEGLEHIKKTTIRERSNGRGNGNNHHGFLDRISRIAHGGRSRNPAKKSASFTFAVRPEIGMRSPERYASLESETNLMQPMSRQQVQRSVSTSVLEVQPTGTGDMDPPYSKVRDSLTPLPPTPPPKPEEIYAEICEPGNGGGDGSLRHEKPPPPLGKNTGTRERDRGYVKLAHSEVSALDVLSADDEEGIYNTVC